MKTIPQFILVCFVILLAKSFVAQESFGYYGKKSYVQGNITINTPFIYNKIYQSELDYSQNLLLTKDKLNVGFRLAGGTALNRSFGLAFETGFDYSSVYVLDTRFDTTTNVGPQTWMLTHENMDARTANIALLMEFSSKSGLLPMGLSHQFGVNFASSKYIYRDYNYTLVDYVNTGGSYTYDAHPLIDINGMSSVKKMGLIYNMNMRKPLNKSIFLNYGFKYNFNLIRIAKNSTGTRSYFSDMQTDLNTQLSRSRLTQILYFYIGVAMAF